MAKIVLFARSRAFKIIATMVVVLAVAFGVFSCFSARSAEAEVAGLLADHTFVRSTGSTQGYNLFASHCLRNDSDYHAAFVDDFNNCVRESESVYRSMFSGSIPSEACIRDLPEKSRQEILCIIDAEEPAMKAVVDWYTQDREARWKKMDAEAKVEQTKRNAEDKAIAPAIQKAIQSLNPQDDTARRYAAISASCKYTEQEAGYRVAYEAYAHASQKGIDAATRFDNGRDAICNESQVQGR